MFLRDWNDFAAKIEIRIVLDCFGGIEVLDVEYFCPKSKEKRNWT